MGGFEWATDGTVETSGGLVDSLLVGGGSYRTLVPRFCGGRVNQGILSLGTSHTVTVGKGQATQSATWGTGSAISGVVEQGPVPYPATGTYVDAGTAPNGGVLSSITGTEVNYAAQGLGTPGGSSPLDGTSGLDGVVVIRVPAALTEKVPSGSWVTRSNYFAVVKNGVVTETYTEHHYGNGTTTPLPQTDLIPCDANVTEGYSYENGEFVSPPAPEIPAAQQEILDKINELEQELRSYDV